MYTRRVLPLLLVACATEAVMTDPASIPLPDGSGDYREVLALATSHRAGAMDFEALTRAVVARGLPPHPLGDAYLMIPVPAPPPGSSFDPRQMPKDWEGTWGEVAMAYWLGALTRDEYDRLHRAAHPACGAR
jgi:hypothetical protein